MSEKGKFENGFILKENFHRNFDRFRTRLFTAFYRCSNTGKLPGTGLGLTIVKEVVELQGGTISVSSLVGKGTTSTVSIPIL
ncbi:MAG: sensor histidine kinase [Leptolyngbyaceae cyanobacterium RM2_2_4]|nr:sensor histidine kinase [Leptolyngbyaceae cyanobacterium SM1_4_3]NJO50118.1 sensor histidine kinase [Leptolyngbyaceae cyanobacterium RM2_2_4]